MATPVILYTSAGMPIGSYAGVPLFRVTPGSVSINGTPYSVATAPAFGTLGGGATALGTYVCEKASLSLKGREVQRMDSIGTPSDKSLLRDDPDLTMTLQAANIGTPSLMPGDCMEISIGMKGSSTTGAPVPIASSRWFLKANGINYDSGDPTKFSATFSLDRQNSSPSLSEF